MPYPKSAKVLERRPAARPCWRSADGQRLAPDRGHLGACRVSFGANISDDMAAADGAPALGARVEQVSEMAMVVAMEEPAV